VTGSEAPTSIPRLLKLLYWRLRRNPRAAPHIAATLFSFSRNYLMLSLKKCLGRSRRPMMAMALIEHLGDIVADEPIARAARLKFPNHCICWIVKPAYGELPENYPEVDRVVPVRCLTESMLLHAAGLFDEMWEMHVGGHICEKCGIQKVGSGPAPKPDMTNYYRFGNIIGLHCLSAGIPPVSDAPVLSPPPDAVASVNRLGLPNRFVAIHCISNDGVRDWPAAKWQRLVAAIANDLLVNVVELGLQPFAVPHDGALVRNLCGQLSIMQTAEVIRRATLFIGIDSGPAHLANAVGTQGVLLFGPCLGMDDYMPFSGGYQDGSIVDILRASEVVANLSVETVLTAVSRRLRVVEDRGDERGDVAAEARKP
jgi:heptosyltransferase-3